MLITNKNEAVKKIQDFNKAAIALFSLSFNKKIKDSGYTIKFEKGKGWSYELRGPDDEAIKALCNDLRKFIQPNDLLRIHKLIPIYQSDLVQEKEKKIFNQTISEYDKLKNQPTPHTVNKEVLTKQKIFEVFLYGTVSHQTEGTKEVHDAWETFPPAYIPLKNEFIIILHEHLRIINNIVYTNNCTLEKLGYPQIKIDPKNL